MSIIQDTISVISGFRKWSIMMTLIILAAVFRYTDLLNGAEMVDLLKHVAIAFMATNGIEHTTKAIGEWVKSKYNEKKEING